MDTSAKFLFPLDSMKYYAGKAGVKLTEDEGAYILEKGGIRRRVVAYSEVQKHINEMMGLPLTRPTPSSRV